MNMQLEESGRLKVTLDRFELEDFDLDFESLDYNLPRTRDLLNTLLIQAAAITGFELKPGRLFIEAYPDNNGGCVIYFTIKARSQRSRIYRRKKDNSYIYEFPGWDSLFDAVAAIGPDNRKVKTSLFALDGRLLLELCEKNPSLSAVLNEFADNSFSSPGKLLYLHEHGKCLCQGNALSRLCRGLS